MFHNSFYSKQFSMFYFMNYEKFRDGYFRITVYFSTLNRHLTLQYQSSKTMILNIFYKSGMLEF